MLSEQLITEDAHKVVKLEFLNILSFCVFLYMYVAYSIYKTGDLAQQILKLELLDTWSC